MGESKEDQKNLKEKNKFLNFNGKNFAIIILSILLFLVIATYPNDNSAKITELNNQIQSLNQQIEEKNKTIEDNTELKNLQIQIDNLQSENTKLENEKNELNKKLESAQKTSSNSQQSSNTISSNSSTNKKTVKSQEASTTSTPQGTIVYITNTGKKYHRSNCSYLRNSKISINISDAKAKGYTACSRCNP